jgi:hypothetical protein
MSINRDMKKVSLEKKTIVQAPSGQKKETWVKDKDIDLAIYPVQGSIMLSNNVKFNQSTNTGLTRDVNIKESSLADGNRINDNGVIYTINFVNEAGRFAQLLLQKNV